MKIEIYADGNTHAYAVLLVARTADGAIAKKRLLSDVLEDQWTPTQSTWIAARTGLDTLGNYQGDVFIYTRLKGLANRHEGNAEWVYRFGSELQHEAYEECERLLKVYQANDLVNAYEPRIVQLEDYFSRENIIKARARARLFVADVETARIERKGAAE